jgi:hypothetical protein
MLRRKTGKDLAYPASILRVDGAGRRRSKASFAIASDEPGYDCSALTAVEGFLNRIQRRTARASTKRIHKKKRLWYQNASHITRALAKSLRLRCRSEPARRWKRCSRS